MESRSWLLALANLLLPLACLLFASGFFPYKPFLPGLAEYEGQNEGNQPTAPFDKIIFMVIDALRSDFVFSRQSGFHFTQSLIANGSAIPFTAHATAPTVTMPRVKAITTGSIPSFLDMILNFAESDTTSTLANQDTWLAQMRTRKQGHLVMYGDDTWLKLFPGTFHRADGTSSFFVSDFTEVDNNVTRHIPHELNQPDWNVMIMHYLGVDHIGHKSGPRSVNMIPKQKEMDGIVQQIYSAMHAKQHLESTLLVVCGDHGMNEGGNHGGSAPGETATALVFISPKIEAIARGQPCPTDAKGDFDFYSLVEQSDLAPTIAGLLGIPVSLNNLGVFIPQFLGFWRTERERLQLLLGNALQMLEIAKQAFPHPFYENTKTTVDCEVIKSSAMELVCAWKAVTDHLPIPSNEIEEAKLRRALQSFATKAQQLLSSTASNYNIARLLYGIACASLATVLAFMACRFKPGFLRSLPDLYTCFVAVANAVMMLASSYVEEEQQYWYLVTSTWLFMQYFRRFPRDFRGLFLSPWLPLTILFRIVLRWNQSGQKHAGEADIVRQLTTPPGPLLLWALATTTLLTTAWRTRSCLSSGGRAALSQEAAGFASLLLAGAAAVFKAAFTVADQPELLDPSLAPWLGGLNLVTLARLVFLWTGMAAGIVLFYFFNHPTTGEGGVFDHHDLLLSSLQPLVTLVLIMQTRLTNVPLLLIFHIQQRLLSRLHLPAIEATLATFLLGYSSFFAMGNTNSISSLDLSLAYNGISSYNPLPVGILLFVGNWAGPIYWTFAGAQVVLESAQRDYRSYATFAKLALREKQQAQAEAAQLAKPNPPRHGLYPRNKRKQKQRLPDSPTALNGDNDTTLQNAEPDEATKSVISSLRARYTATLRDAWLHHVSVLTFAAAVQLLGVMVACLVLRQHLFVWTVFSPKFLVAVAWIAWHLFGVVFLSGVLAFVE